jgi:hypothetical protein
MTTTKGTFYNPIDLPSLHRKVGLKTLVLAKYSISLLFENQKHVGLLGIPQKLEAMMLYSKTLKSIVFEVYLPG